MYTENPNIDTFCHGMVTTAKELITSQELIPVAYFMFEFKGKVETVRIPAVSMFMENNSTKALLATHIKDQWVYAKLKSQNQFKLMAVILLSDAYVVARPIETLTDGSSLPMPSKQPDRMEALNLQIYMAEKKYGYMHIYKRVQGKIEFEPIQGGAEDYYDKRFLLDNLWPYSEK